MYNCESWSCEVEDDGHGISSETLEFVGCFGCTRCSTHFFFVVPQSFHSKCAPSSLPEYMYGHLGRSLACISSISQVIVVSAAGQGAAYSRKIGDQPKVEIYNGSPLKTTGTRVTCTKMFEGRQSLRQKQQMEFRTQHSKFVRFLGMFNICR